MSPASEAVARRPSVDALLAPDQPDRRELLASGKVEEGDPVDQRRGRSVFRRRIREQGAAMIEPLATVRPASLLAPTRTRAFSSMSARDERAPAYNAKHQR
jgi:hypothetical protein